MENLIEKLNLLWASKILNYDYDMLLNNITFLLETLDDGQIHRYELKFKKVSMVYFVNNVGDTRFNIFEPDEDDYLEFTSISILEDVKFDIESERDEWLKQYQGKANVCIEIWSKVLLIEADSIELNNENCSLSK